MASPKTSLPITPRHREIIDLVMQGMTNVDIGERLFIAETTVKYHLTEIYKRKSVTSRYELIALMARELDEAAKDITV